AFLGFGVRFVEALHMFPVAEALNRGVAGYGHKPSGELRTALKAAEMLKCFQECVLHRIAGFLRIAQETNQSSVYAPAVPIHEFFKGVQISATHPCHTLGIRVSGYIYTGRTLIRR